MVVEDGILHGVVVVDGKIHLMMCFGKDGVVPSLVVVDGLGPSLVVPEGNTLRKDSGVEEPFAGMGRNSGAEHPRSPPYQIQRRLGSAVRDYGRVRLAVLVLVASRRAVPLFVWGRWCVCGKETSPSQSGRD